MVRPESKAGLDHYALGVELGERGIPRQYGLTEAQEDLAHARRREGFESGRTRCHACPMKMTLDLKPAAARIARAVSRDRKITLDEAVSELILKATSTPAPKISTRHGIPLARNDGVTVTAAEVAVALNDA